MGYTSNVKILMGKKAFDLLKARCLASEDENVRAMVDAKENYVEIQTSEENGSYPEDSVSIKWVGFKWYNNYEEVKAINRVLTELDSNVEEIPESIKDYFYKMIQIGEDNATDERSNDDDDEYVSDFYVNCEFSI